MGPTAAALPSSFIGPLPKTVRNASSDLLPRILSNEIEFRSSILDRIAYMEGHIVKALEDKLYSVDLASMPTLLREWRGCLELSLRIVERTKGLNTGDAATDQVSGLLAKEALLRHELERLGVVDGSGRIVAPIEHTEQVGGGMTTKSLSGAGRGENPDVQVPLPLPAPVTRGTKRGRKSRVKSEESREGEVDRG
jgi:hypothetical protein